MRGKGIGKLKRRLVDHLSLAVQYAPDNSWTNQDPPVCKGAVGGHHLLETDIKNSQGQGRVRFHLALDTQAAGHVQDRLVTQLKKEVHRSGVIGALQGGSHGYGSRIFSGIVNGDIWW